MNLERLGLLALHYVGVAAVVAIAEVVLTAIEAGAPMPDLRTVLAAGLGVALRGSLAIVKRFPIPEYDYQPRG